MRNVLAIARKELSNYFTTPWAYVVFTAMIALSSFFFLGLMQTFKQVQEMAQLYGWNRMPADYGAFRNLTDGVVVQLWGVVLVITLFVAPILSMRLFSEEKGQRTFELLMTAPVRPVEIVLGKYLGALGVVASTLGLTIVFPIILEVFGASESGRALEWSTVLLGYGGMLLWGATCIAIGLFISSLTGSMIISALVTFVVLIAWMLLKNVATGAEEPVRSIVSYLSFDTQLQPMLRGVLDLKAIVFFVSVIAFSLFLTHRAVEAQRWA